MARFCMRCGNPLQGDEKFCRSCGFPTDGTLPDEGAATPADPSATAAAPAVPGPSAAAPAPQTAKRGVPVAALVGSVVGVLAVCGIAFAVLAFHPFGIGAPAEQGDGTTVSALTRDGEGDEADDEVDVTEIEPADDADDAADDAADGATDGATTNTETQVQSQPQSTVPNNYYVCPDSATRVYSDSELYAMTADELELARNEIYARYGRGFSTDYLQEYFDSQAWYTRLYSPEEFDAMTSPLNSVEQQNVANMLRVEKDLRY